MRPGVLELCLRAVAPRRGRDRLRNVPLLEPIQKVEKPGLERDAVALDDGVVGDVPRAHEVRGGIVVTVTVDDDGLAVPEIAADHRGQDPHVELDPDRARRVRPGERSQALGVEHEPVHVEDNSAKRIPPKRRYAPPPPRGPSALGRPCGAHLTNLPARRV
jgi:hypothetical protein